MRLSELNPQFLSSGGVAKTEGVGVAFDCPCGNHDEEHRCYVPFENPIGPGPTGKREGWVREGDSFETLSLRPSIYRKHGCGWHGYITKGEVQTV